MKQSGKCSFRKMCNSNKLRKLWANDIFLSPSSLFIRCSPTKMDLIRRHLARSVDTLDADISDSVSQLVKIRTAKYGDDDDPLTPSAVGKSNQTKLFRRNATRRKTMLDSFLRSDPELPTSKQGSGTNVINNMMSSSLHSSSSAGLSNVYALHQKEGDASKGCAKVGYLKKRYVLDPCLCSVHPNMSSIVSNSDLRRKLTTFKPKM